MLRTIRLCFVTDVEIQPIMTLTSFFNRKSTQNRIALFRQVLSHAPVNGVYIEESDNSEARRNSKVLSHYRGKTRFGSSAIS